MHEKGGGRVEVIFIGDIPITSAVDFLKKELSFGTGCGNCVIANRGLVAKADDLEDVVKNGLGGRLNDLDIFRAKVLAGIKPHDALHQMLHEAINDIYMEGFGIITKPKR